METRSNKETHAGRLALSRDEAAEAIGTSVGFVDLEVRRGHLRSVKRGRRVLILRRDLERYLEAEADGD